MSQQPIDLYTRQNPRNYTQQLQQRQANRLLANKLVNIKPIVDNKIPQSYKMQKAKDLQMRSVRRSSQTGSISQSGHQQNRSIEFSQSLYQATPGPNLGELDTSINNATIDDLYRASTNRESGQSPMLQANEQSFFEPYGDRSTLQQRGRQPTDSLMSNHLNHQQQSVQTSQHQGGSVQPQQSNQAPRQVNRVAKQRQRQIENDNQVLLKKMISIMNRKQNLQNGVPRVSKVAQHNSVGNQYKNRVSSSDAMQPVGISGPIVEMNSVRMVDQKANKGFKSVDKSQKIALAPKLQNSQALQANQNTQLLLSSDSNRQSKTLAVQQYEALYATNPMGQNTLLESSQMSSQEMQKGVVISNRSPGTLNFSTRKKQIERINHENLQMLRTLQQTKPTVSYDQWREHARRQDNYKKNVSKTGMVAMNFNQLKQQQRQTFQPKVPEIDQFAMHIIQENKGPQQPSYRAGVKSGSLPKRSNFYVHTKHVGSKKAKSSHTYAGGPFRNERGSVKQPTPNHNRTPKQLQQMLNLRPQPDTSAFEDSTEVTQKIESVINMFPQPTEEQLQQFKELHDEHSQTELLTNPASHETFQNDMNTITNIQVTPADNKSDNQAQNYNLEILTAAHNSQVVSQPIVDQNANNGDDNATNALQQDNRRVKTTMPGKRNRAHGSRNERTSANVVGIDVLPERVPSFDMQNIQKPASMANSLNSGSHVPQIIVRQGGRIPGWTGCNPMLIPMEHREPPPVFLPQNMMPQQPPMQVQQNAFYPRQMNSIDHGWNMQQESYSAIEDLDEEQMMHQNFNQSRDEFASMNVPKANFYDYQYEEGPQYNISFDPRSGQPRFSDMDALTMNAKLSEMQNEIHKRMNDENVVNKTQYRMMKAKSQKQKNIKQILQAYAYKNAQLGPYGTNNNVINQLQQRKVPMFNRKTSLMARPTVPHHRTSKTTHQQPSVSSQQTQLTQSNQHPVKRNLRSQTHSKSPPRKVAPSINAAQSHRHPNTNPGTAARKIRDVANRPAQAVQENNDDQVGGGPAQVSPEVLRMQANRPDERQQIHRRRVPLSQPTEPDASHRKVASDPLNLPSGVTSKKESVSGPAPAKEKEAAPLPVKLKTQKFAPAAAKAPAAKPMKQIVPALQIQKAVSPSTGNKQKAGKRISTQPAPQPEKVVAKHNRNESQKIKPNKSDGSSDSQDQRASSTIEEGIMGLKYLPAGQSPAKEIEVKAPQSRNEPTPLAHPPVESLEEQKNLERIDSKKTSQLTVDAIAPKLEEEEESRKYSSRQGQQPHNISQIAGNNSGTKANSDSHQASPLTRVAPHQETQVGLMHPHNIEDQPIVVDMSDQHSNITEPNKAEASSQHAAQRRLSSGGESLIPERNEEVRQSIGTDGAQNPYSDIEDDDEQAAVGSGIVETNGDYEEDDYEDLNDDYQEFRAQVADSQGTGQIENGSGDVATNHQAPSDEACIGTPVGTIAQLVQKQQQILDEDDSNYSDDADEDEPQITPSQPQQAKPSAIAIDDEEDAEDYENDKFMESGSREMAATAQFAPIKNLAKNESEGDYVDDDDDDYEQDEFSQQQSKAERKMSLESDQDAPENEFEQIKDEDYAEEDDERY